jgi:hypothetical protein
MEITEQQKEELGRQLARIQRHWKRIAEFVRRNPSKVPKSLDDFSSDEAEQISLYLSTV